MQIPADRNVEIRQSTTTVALLRSPNFAQRYRANMLASDFLFAPGGVCHRAFIVSLMNSGVE